MVCFGLVAGFVAPENRTSFAMFFGFGEFIVAFSGYMLALRHGANPPAVAPSPADQSVVAEELATYVTGDVGPVRK